MPLIKITAEDVKRGKILDPGYYECQITDFIADLSKDKKSTNYIVDFLVTKSKNPAFEGVPLRRYFSEKAMGMMIPFLKALGVEVGEEGADVDLSRDALVGKSVLVSVVPKPDKDGNIRNTVGDGDQGFRKVS